MEAVVIQISCLSVLILFAYFQLVEISFKISRTNKCNSILSHQLDDLLQSIKTLDEHMSNQLSGVNTNLYDIYMNMKD